MQTFEKQRVPVMRDARQDLVLKLLTPGRKTREGFRVALIRTLKVT